jgi:hypothetical protein
LFWPLASVKRISQAHHRAFQTYHIAVAIIHWIRIKEQINKHTVLVFKHRCTHHRYLQKSRDEHVECLSILADKESNSPRKIHNSMHLKSMRNGVNWMLSPIYRFNHLKRTNRFFWMHKKKGTNYKLDNSHCKYLGL